MHTYLPRDTRKLAGPGLFRLLLATVVFAHHVSRFAVGGAAVYIFFCLSGYWICKMWRGRYSRTTNPYFTYVVSRTWRLLPAFVLIGAVTSIIDLANGTPIEGPKDATAWLHFVLANVFILGYDSLPQVQKAMVPGWSLDFEMQFYIVAPFLLLTLVRSGELRILLITGVLSIVSALWIGPHVLTSYLAFFVIGMVASDKNWRPSGRLALSASLVGAALLIVCILSPYRGALFIGAHPGPLAIYNPEVNVLLGLLMTPYALYTTRQIGFVLDAMFADLSYIVYLLHWGGLQILNLYQKYRISRLALMTIVWVVVYSLAVAIWKVYDRPINEARSKWVSGRSLRGERSIQTVKTEAVAP